MKQRANVRLWDGRDRYMARITNEGQAPSSIKTAHYALERFCKAVATKREPNPYLHLIDAEQADDYCYGERGIRKGIRSDSFNRYRSVLKVFFDYAVAMRWTDANPMAGISPARPDVPNQQLRLNASELITLLDHTATPVERIACSLGMNTGLRANDLKRLTVFDVSLASGEIQTEIRKTKKFDVKPITMDLHPELVRWLDFYAARMGVGGRGDLPDHWLLLPCSRLATPFERDREIHIFPTQMHTHPWRLVQRPLASMGYPTKGTGFHTLRRSSARALFESLRSSNDVGRDHALMIVKDFLNHASTVQTELYLGLNAERDIRNQLLRGKPFLSAIVQTEQERVAEPVRKLGSA